MQRLLIAFFMIIPFSGFGQNDIMDKKELDATVTEMRTIDDKDTSYWKKGGAIGLNGSQVSLTNWAGGGESSISGTALLGLFSNFKKGKMVWDNSLDLGYGLVYQNNRTFKSDDKIDLSSKFGYKAFKEWFYTGLFSFRSQFAPGFSTPADTVRISNFLAPAYIIGSLGLDWKPNEDFTLFLSPATTKMTIVNDQVLADAGAFGVAPAEFSSTGTLIRSGEKFRTEVGGFLKMMWKLKVMENILLTTKLDLFSNYLNNPQNIDINWETALAMKVNKFITVNFSTHLIYDDDIQIAVDDNDDGVTDRTGPRTQFKQVLAVGFSYKF